MVERITKPGTVEDFVKWLHPVRISLEAKTVYMDELDKITKAVTDKAVALMRAGGRTTLSEADAREAFRTTASTGDDAPAMEPAALFRQLDRMPPPKVFEVVRLIQEWLANQSKLR